MWVLGAEGGCSWVCSIYVLCLPLIFSSLPSAMAVQWKSHQPSQSTALGRYALFKLEISCFLESPKPSILKIWLLQKKPRKLLLQVPVFVWWASLAASFHSRQVLWFVLGTAQDDIRHSHSFIFTSGQHLTSFLEEKTTSETVLL